MTTERQIEKVAQPEKIPRWGGFGGTYAAATSIASLCLPL